ncbi:MAG TPA: hypothetical protein VMD29_11445 [Terracidiphilus sp.]|nr:hypothetical protein [Terracidiphilus sp.]
MNQKATLLSFAALAIAFLIPAGAAAQSASNPQMNDNSTQNSNSVSGQAEASEMVPAQASLDRTLDARDLKPGQAFEAKLASKVHLKDGQELPRGATLIGKVGQDDMNVSGKSKLALCIDEAKLKDGKTIPLKATIVGVYGPQAGDADSLAYNVSPGDQEPNNWSHRVLQVDQIDALSGIDLHSRIGSRNSGVLVSTKKDDIKIKTGTEFALAVAPESQAQSQNSGPGGH